MVCNHCALNSFVCLIFEILISSPNDPLSEYKEEYWSLDQTQPVCKPAGLLTKTEVDGGREDLQGLLNRCEDFLTSKNIFLFNSKWHLQFINGCRLTKTEERRNSEGSFNTGERQEYTTEMQGGGEGTFSNVYVKFKDEQA